MADAGEGEELPSGTRLAELEIERVLGSGGFGVTHLVRDVSSDSWRALKEYLPREWGTRHPSGKVGPRTGSSAKRNRAFGGLRSISGAWSGFWIQEGGEPLGSAFAQAQHVSGPAAAFGLHWSRCRRGQPEP